jgi:DNA-binding helix-hairpin-helix protein with protein kinase domain
MNREVIFEGRPIRLNDACEIGRGGEACVYRAGTLALKIFHAPSNGCEQRTVTTSIAKAMAFPPPGATAVVAPRGLVTTMDGAPVGYGMNFVPHATEMAVLSMVRP